jgi:hypothetical protein
MSEENMSDSYEVGYGKPPRNTQFQKGLSGNPKAVPRKLWTSTMHCFENLEPSSPST